MIVSLNGLFGRAAAPIQPKTIQAFFIGDSITIGVGTTGTSFPGGVGVYAGPSCYAKQTISKLSPLLVTPIIRGFSGQTIDWFTANDLAKTVKMFDFDNYTDVYCILYFGTNDLSAYDAPTFEGNLTTASTALKAGGAKIIVVTPQDVQTASRDNATYNARRASYYTWLTTNYSTFADAVADTSVYPSIYAVGAANNATYFASTSADVSGAGNLHPTDTGAELIARAVASAVTILSTTVSVPIIPTDEASAFITATGITDVTVIEAIHTLVSSLKKAKLWTRLPAIYPFVGGTSDSNKFNLRDPRDTDNAYRLTFSGTPIFDATGVTWVGGSYADTKFVQTSDGILIANNCSLHYYSRSISAGGIDIGAFQGSAVCWLGINRGGGGANYAINVFAGGAGENSHTDTGLFCSARSGDYTSRTFMKNGAILYTQNDIVGSMPTSSFTIGTDNVSFADPSNRNCGYAAIGYGLTQAEEAEHYTIVQVFQSTLGREV